MQQTADTQVGLGNWKNDLDFTPIFERASVEKELISKADLKNTVASTRFSAP